jgi:hypothetical protein
VGEELVGRDVFGEDYLWFYDDTLDETALRSASAAPA